MVEKVGGGVSDLSYFFKSLHHAQKIPSSPQDGDKSPPPAGGNSNRGWGDFFGRGCGFWFNFEILTPRGGGVVLKISLNKETEWWMMEYNFFKFSDREQFEQFDRQQNSNQNITLWFPKTYWGNPRNRFYYKFLNIWIVITLNIFSGKGTMVIWEILLIFSKGQCSTSNNGHFGLFWAGFRINLHILSPKMCILAQKSTLYYQNRFSRPQKCFTH